jgi:hypothetical protein
MFKKLASVVITTALVCTLGGTAAVAKNTAPADEKADTARSLSEVPAKEEVKPNEQLNKNMLKLVADAKAGKIAPAAKSQIQPARSNNWSKRKKIAVGVGIPIAVVVTFLVVKYATLL